MKKSHWELVFGIFLMPKLASNWPLDDEQMKIIIITDYYSAIRIGFLSSIHRDESISEHVLSQR